MIKPQVRWSVISALPVGLFSWGGDAFPGGRSYETLGSNRHGFKGVIESVRQRFTMVSSLGVPLRATLAISMKEYKTLSELVAEQSVQSSDRPASQVVGEGQSLTDVADAQGNGDDWRGMADAWWRGIHAENWVVSETRISGPVEIEWNFPR